MAPDKIAPTDSRVSHHNTTLRGKTYHYMLAKPQGEYKGTILLIHGWPDLGLSWRYQVPLLAALGLQVVVPDMLGYGGTDAPDEIEPYSLKQVSSDMAELAAQVAPGEQIILGGHDWGGMLVWRMTQWFPDLIRAVFSVCTPFVPTSPVLIDVDQIGNYLPNFAYQKQLAGPELPERLTTEPKIRQFLTGMYGGRGPNKEPAFSVSSGVLWENLDLLGPSPLFSKEEMDYYVEQYTKKGLRGPTNWYRTRPVNFEEEKELLANPKKIAQPSLHIAAKADAALPPAMAEGMEKHFEDLTKKTVDGSHWCLWPPSTDQTNVVIQEWLVKVLKGVALRASM
jgi:soluble epoxide hydrolase / lipid-phosphate phosphatase